MYTCIWTVTCPCSDHPITVRPPPAVSDADLGAAGEETLPITSYACQWIQPRKRKESNKQMAGAKFEKHVYGRQCKHTIKSIEDFDPRPPECIGTAQASLGEFLTKMRGKGLGVSALMDPKVRVWKPGCSSDATPEGPPSLPSKEELICRVSAFKESLKVSAERVCEIEKNTRDQSQSPLWYSERQFRLTASFFGEVRRRLPSTPPESLVLRILGLRKFTAKATEWGMEQEPLALEAYVRHQHASGHDGLFACKSGFLISVTHPYLGASPDACVHDPTFEEIFGLAEIKCPYSQRNNTPEEACSGKDLCCTLEQSSTETRLKLKPSHPYYSQVQGQMAIAQRPWCDFIIYTPRGLSVERIHFNQSFWNSELLPKLTSFYDNCVAPEIVSPMHAVGLPVRNLLNL